MINRLSTARYACYARKAVKHNAVCQESSLEAALNIKFENRCSETTMSVLTKQCYQRLFTMCIFFRFVQYNGGIGQQQLLWLEVQLAEASRAGQRVVLFGHLPTHPDASEAKCLLWNFDEVSTSILWILGMLFRSRVIAMQST